MSPSETEIIWILSGACVLLGTLVKCVAAYFRLSDDLQEALALLKYEKEQARNWKLTADAREDKINALKKRLSSLEKREPLLF